MSLSRPAVAAKAVPALPTRVPLEGTSNGTQVAPLSATSAATLRRRHALLSGQTRQARRLTLLLLGLIILLGWGLRAALIASAGGMIDGDEALVGLQARHILSGERPIFFYGQHYMGSLEAYLAALVFRLFGATASNLHAVPLIWALALIWLTYLLGKTIWDRPSGLLAALLVAVAPLYVTIWTVKARGGFVETLVFGDLLLLIGLALARRRHSPAALWALWGGIAGLAFWTNGMIVYYLAATTPLLVMALWRSRQRLMALLGLGGGALLGALPLLVDNIRSGGATLSFLAGGNGVTNPHTWDQAPAVLSYFINACVPELTGAWQPHTQNNSWLAPLPLLLYGLAVLASLVRIAARPASRVGEVTLLWLVILVPLVFTLSGFGGPSLNSFGFDATGRYTLPLAAVAPLFAGALFRDLGRWRVAAALLPAGCLIGINIVGLVQSTPGAIFQSEYWQRLPISNAPLIAALHQAGVSYVWLNHWAGAPVMFESRETIIAADYNDVVLNHGSNRLPWALQRVTHARAGTVAFVLVTGEGRAGAQVTPLQRRLVALHVRATRIIVPPYQVFIPLSRRVDPAEVAGTIGYQY